MTRSLLPRANSWFQLTALTIVISAAMLAVDYGPDLWSAPPGRIGGHTALPQAPLPSSQQQATSPGQKSSASSAPNASAATEVALGDTAAARHDYATAMHLYRKAAERGNFQAEADVGCLYENGWGVKADAVAAAQWFNKATAAGWTESASRCDLTATGEPSPPGSPTESAATELALGQAASGHKDYALAMRWYLKAAAGGSAEAESMIGGLYLDGLGVATNYRLAAHWFGKAGTGGYTVADLYLGYLYDTGQGVEGDPKRAEEFISKGIAAFPNATSAALTIGDLYYNHAEYRRALLWARKAAAHNDATAETDLGVLYELGRGTKRNFPQAIGFYEQAIRDGDHDASAVTSVNLARQRLALLRSSHCDGSGQC